MLYVYEYFFLFYLFDYYILKVWEVIFFGVNDVGK